MDSTTQVSLPPSFSSVPAGSSSPLDERHWPQARAEDAAQKFRNFVELYHQICEQRIKIDPEGTAEPDEQVLKQLLSGMYFLEDSDMDIIWEAASVSVDAALRTNDPSKRVLPFAFSLEDSTGRESPITSTFSNLDVFDAVENVNINSMSRMACTWARASFLATLQSDHKASVGSAFHDRLSRGLSTYEHDSEIFK
ncbi:hypothetical protein I302_106628 [Kwoniella bestiolae CBS 10118]|uniref:Uncharacterized protein n=1 Tax=Kwoniella bestiolae CBS 10118 TaxID=1296100 RepID=A0AAJ8KC23_9TREE